MTFQKDKLIAIKGIADAAAPIVSRDYFAGFWIGSHRSITMGLLWSSSSSSSSRQNIITHQRLDLAPSWSWASTPGKVSWQGHWLCQLEPRISIIDLKKLETTATRARAELVVETHLRPGSKRGGAFAIVDWPSTHAADAPFSRSWPVDRPATAIALDEVLENIVLVEAGQESTYCRVGYSIWPESTWMNKEFPETKKMRLRLM